MEYLETRNINQNGIAFKKKLVFKCLMADLDADAVCANWLAKIH